jgi:hypothetical protein
MSDTRLVFTLDEIRRLTLAITCWCGTSIQFNDSVRELAPEIICPGCQATIATQSVVGQHREFCRRAEAVTAGGNKADVSLTITLDDPKSWFWETLIRPRSTTAVSEKE